MKPYFETKLGKLYHGDCQNIISETQANILLMDPLYGNNVNLQRAHENKREKQRVLNGLKLKRYNWPEIKGNDKPLDPSPFLKFKQAIVWGGNYIADKLPPSEKWIIWDKLHIPPDNHHDCEMAWTNLKGVTRVFRHLWRGICRAGEENISNGPKLHPFQKPISLMCFCLEQFVINKNSIILDPYIGSGTTAVACERYGIQWIGIEISEEYCEISAKRIEQETKQLKLWEAS